MKKKILVGYIMDGTSGGIDRYLLRFIEQGMGRKTFRLIF